MEQPVTIEYRTPAPPPKVLTVERGEGWVRVVFPVWPVWIEKAAIVVTGLMGLLKLCALGMYIRVIHTLGMFSGTLDPEVSRNAWRTLWQVTGFLGGSAILWCAAAGVLWWRYRRWGQVPRTLTASASGLELSCLYVWRVHHRHWSPDQLLKVEYKPQRWILRPKWTSADLIVRRRHLWPLYFRLSSSDPQLPRQIAEEIASILGKELEQPKESPAYGEQAGRGTSDSASGGYR